MTVLKRMELDASSDEDMVVLALGSLRPIIPYQTAFDVAQALRVAAKQAARFDRAPATFVNELSLGDPRENLPEPHPTFRRSTKVPNVRSWEARVNPPLAGLVFDETITEMSYEDAVRLAWKIRRAGHEAKRWAGDRSKTRRARGNLNDAEENYRLGLA